MADDLQRSSPWEPARRSDQCRESTAGRSSKRFDIGVPDEFVGNDSPGSILGEDTELVIVGTLGGGTVHAASLAGWSGETNWCDDYPAAMTIEIVRADRSHVAEVGRLFDLYRQFYECPPDIPLATDYISDRVANDESIIWVAMDGAAAKGFVQCYSSFCSVQAVKIHILYDLYVEAGQRNTGLGAQLMNQARDYAIADGAKRIDLLTQHSNNAGQHLYEKLGYEIANADFHAYSLNL